MKVPNISCRPFPEEIPQLRALVRNTSYVIGSTT